MSDQIKLDSSEALRIANSLAQASAKILDFRVDNFDRLSDEEAAKLEQQEDNLDHMVVLLRSRGVELIGEEAAAVSQELTAAIEDGKEVLSTIKDVRNALRVAVGLTELAVAVLGRNAKGALSALKELRSVAKEYDIGSDRISELLGQV